MYENFTEYKTAETATMKCFEDELSDSELLRFRLSLVRFLQNADREKLHGLAETPRVRTVQNNGSLEEESPSKTVSYII